MKKTSTIDPAPSGAKETARTEPVSKSVFEKWRQKNVAALEKHMGRALYKMAQAQPPEIVRLIEAMRYSLLSGGKRIRPLLALAAAEAVGGRSAAALPAAMAVEMVHAYSLIHDDLPAMDDDDLRRGRPTCHKAYDEGTAILAGDGLLTLAFEVLLVGSGRDAARRAGAARHLARSAGALGMVGGQALDLAYENKNNRISGEMVRDMELRKTGELMSAALVCGALSGGAETGQLRVMRKIGLNLGLAFQIQDDLLNRHGDAELLGKAVGSDLERGKATFPEIMGEEEAVRSLARLTRQCLGKIDGFGPDGRHLKSLVESLISRQS